MCRTLQGRERDQALAEELAANEKALADIQRQVPFTSLFQQLIQVLNSNSLLYSKKYYYPRLIKCNRPTKCWKFYFTTYTISFYFIFLVDYFILFFGALRQAEGRRAEGGVLEAAAAAALEELEQIQPKVEQWRVLLSERLQAEAPLSNKGQGGEAGATSSDTNQLEALRRAVETQEAEV
jgi:hypothetical protein